MTPEEIEGICMILRKRVVPKDAEEGAAIYGLAHKLAVHFTPKPAPATVLEKAGGTD